MAFYCTKLDEPRVLYVYDSGFFPWEELSVSGNVNPLGFIVCLWDQKKQTYWWESHFETEILQPQEKSARFVAFICARECQLLLFLPYTNRVGSAVQWLRLEDLYIDHSGAT